MAMIIVDDDLEPIVSAFVETLKAKLAVPAAAKNVAAERPPELAHEDAAAFVGCSSDALRHARARGFFKIPDEARKVGRGWVYSTPALEHWRAVRSADKAA